MRNIGIYVHIPFCKQKCSYCDFCSFCAEQEIIEKYFPVLKKEIEFKGNKSDFKVSSVYFGGGTPSSVDENFIVETLCAIKENFILEKDIEITIESNPCSTTRKKLEAYLSAGFNRISFGVQSFNDEILKTIGRLHTCVEAEKAINLAKEVGFKNISADLMIGLPYQTETGLENDIKRLHKLGVNHISSYILQLEEGTMLYTKVQEGKIKVTTDEEAAALYEYTVKVLDRLSYQQYEVSNFAKNKTYSRHNLNYWRRGEYLGFGLSAHSFMEGKRYANASEFKDYKEGKIGSSETLSSKEELEEFIMLGLRYFEGIDLEKINKIDKNVKAKLLASDYLKKGVLKLENNHLMLDPKYYAINNEIIVNLIDFGY